MGNKKQPRVLVIVSGGVADYVADPGVDVEVFDRDNYDADPVGTEKVPAHFADLADPIDVPVKNDREVMASVLALLKSLPESSVGNTKIHFAMHQLQNALKS